MLFNLNRNDRKYIEIISLINQISNVNVNKNINNIQNILIFFNFL
jgi:hypothetical protein